MATFPSRSRGFSLASLGVLVTAIALPLGVLRWSTRYADRLASTIATQISAIAKLGAVPAESVESELDIAALVGALPDALPASEPAAALAVSGSNNGKPRAKAKASHGIRVSSAQVLALAARRAMPKALPVKATAEHPAGLLLRGVSGLGLGMVDGDVLTEAAGQKATSVAVVVGVVLAARGRQAREISGRFYRAGVPYSIVVEQPYPKAAVPSAASTGNPG